MDTALTRLLLRDRQEEDPESGVIRRHEPDLIMGLVVYLPVQRVGPEARETERIVRIEAEGDEPRSHPALRPPTCRVTPSDGADRTALLDRTCAVLRRSHTPHRRLVSVL